MATYVLPWPGPKGGQIGVGFDDKHFSRAQMSAEIDLACEAHSNLPDEVPAGTSFVFSKESTQQVIFLLAWSTIERGPREERLAPQAQLLRRPLPGTSCIHCVLRLLSCSELAPELT